MYRAHLIDRWDDATGSNLYEHRGGVNDLRLASAPSPPRGYHFLSLRPGGPAF